MIRKTNHNKPIAGRTSCRRRSGYLTAELLISAILIASMIGIVGPLAIRSGRLWQDTKQYNVAIDELTNQMELLTLLSPQQLDQAVKDLTPSSLADERLPGVNITAQLSDDSLGRKITLSIQWDRFAVAKPLTLVGWNASIPSGQSKDESSEESDAKGDLP